MLVKQHLLGLALGGFLLACASEPEFVTLRASKAPRDAGTNEGDADIASLGDASARWTRPELDPGSPHCTPEPGRCDAFTNERPSVLSEHSAVYDEARRQMLVFGGTPTIPVNCVPVGGVFVNDLWRYDDPCKQWQRVEASGEPTPGPRARHMAAYGEDTMWIFGGRFRAADSGPYQLYNELWSFDLSEESWRQLPAADLLPSPRSNGVLLFDEVRRRLWLMGGNQSEHGTQYLPTNDVWSYSLEEQSWQRHNTSIGPAPRLFHTGLFDVQRDRIVIFGGANEQALSATASYFSDVWALDPELLDWEPLAPALAGPQGRFWSRWVHDTKADAYLLFAGHDDAALGNRNDLWRFDPDAHEWNQVGVEDTYLTEAQGTTCELPADFARVDLRAPERRNAHSWVWSNACEHAILFGGKTDCGSADDIWRWSDSGQWGLLRRARQGEVCHRASAVPELCGGLCL